MGHTDAQNMARPDDLSEAQLRALISEYEERLASTPLPAGFSTALSDDDRRYLDLCAALHALESGEKPCEEGQEAGGS